MIYSLDNFELLWETYEFHTKYISELESDHIKHMEEFNKSSNEKDSFNLIGDNTLCCNKLINGYVKNIDSIDDLISSYKYFHLNGINIPEERELDINSLYDLRGLSETLIKEITLYRDRIQAG